MSTTGEQLSPNSVLIAGGGPVGLLLSKVLAEYGIKSVVVERNESTTEWPKMDLTNCRSMEIFRRLGLADALRSKGVASHIPQQVLFSTGLPSKRPLTRWQLPSVDQFRARIEANNDGTQPLEPWQRLSQVIFEAWLREICEADPLIDLRYGWAVDNVEESQTCVKTKIRNTTTGESKEIICDYAAGCDGAGSRVRRSLGLPLDGGPVDASVLLVHFKSRDLTRIHKQGQFWHIFFIQNSGQFTGSIIAQDEVDTWTIHMFLPLDADESKIDSKEAIYRTLGGAQADYQIDIDEILVRSVWRPNIAVARTWIGPQKRVFLAGDSAHQLIPTGGYGMNTGIGDAYDLGWKLAAVINGYAGKALLESYEAERRPVAVRNSEQSGVHMNVHMTGAALLTGQDLNTLTSDTEVGKEIRQTVHDHYQTHDGENKSFGIEMGYRYKSPVIFSESNEEEEPLYTVDHYTPTTWPGSRPPHVFLRDGVPIFDLFHPKGWTLVTFSNDSDAEHMIRAAQEFKVPLKHLHLPEEPKARELWEKDMVLVRPDMHVAWRGQSIGSLGAAKEVVSLVTGNSVAEKRRTQGTEKPTHAFTSTTGLETQTTIFELEKAGAFQK